MRLNTCLKCGALNSECQCGPEDDGGSFGPFVISVGPMMQKPVLTITKDGVVTIKDDLTLAEAQVALRMMGEALFRLSVDL